MPHRARALIRICPLPVHWNAVFEALMAHAKTHRCDPPIPPKPLILGGWNYSNDIDKLSRWADTVLWAEANGCLALTELREECYYETSNPTEYEVGPMGGPLRRPWDFEPKARPTNDEAREILLHLKQAWVSIAGPELSTITTPLELTGARLRRLVVAADGRFRPPWGGWKHRVSDPEKRETFTLFRRAINEAIAPHEVDHVDFIEQSSVPGNSETGAGP